MTHYSYQYPIKSHSLLSGESTYIRTPQSQIVALAEKDATLRCAFSYPGDRPVSHIIEWSKRGDDVPIFIAYDGYPPHVDPRYKDRLFLAQNMDERASLVIKKVRREDEGWYECKVQLLNRPPETPKNGSWIFLVVHAPPQIISAPPLEIYVKQDDEVRLQCEAEGTPRPKISWIKDGEVVRSTTKMVIAPNGLLTIRSITGSDVGVYECSARNAEGRVSRASKLIMASGAVILRPPENLTRLEGDRADFHCKAEGKPNNLTFHWLRNDVPIHSSYFTELSTRVVVQTDGTLIINPTSKADSGKYTCRVTNGIEETPEANAWLSIQYPARITFNPSLQYLPLNLSGIIRCYIESNPSLQFVQWTKDQRVLDPKASPGISILSNGSLFIERVTTDHQGQFTCTPYNFHGTSGSSIDMNVLVEDPPMFAIIPKEFYQAEQRGTVSMACSARVVSGPRSPRLNWRRTDGVLIPSDRTRQQDGFLIITNLRKTDHGSYDCVLENEVATLVASTTLLIESTTPHAPTNVTVDVGPFFARIKWQPAYNGGFPQHYVIWYRQFGSSTRQWRTLRVRAADDTSSFTVYNLTPDTLYEFQILSRNQLGDGMFSEPVIVRTADVDSYATVFPTDSSGVTYVPTIVKPSGALPASPFAVTVISTPEGAHVEWEGPQNSSVPIMYYRVEYRKMNEQWGRSSEAIPADGRTFYLAKDIQSGITYEFRVYAFTLTSFSEPSEIVRFTLTSDFAGNLSPTVAIVAGVVGGLIFFVVLTILLLLCAGCARRKRKAKRERYDSDGFHPENDTLTLKRGNYPYCLRSLKGIRRAWQALCAIRLTTISSTATQGTVLQKSFCSPRKLFQRGDLGVQHSRSRCSNESSCSSNLMTNRPLIRILQSRCPSKVIDCRRPETPSFYLTYTPTRSDIYQDYLDSGHAKGSFSYHYSTPVANYDREQLHETIQRLRSSLSAGVGRPSADHSEHADSGVAIAPSSCNNNNSPSSSFTEPPTGASQDDISSGDELTFYLFPSNPDLGGLRDPPEYQKVLIIFIYFMLLCIMTRFWKSLLCNGQPKIIFTTRCHSSLD
ncbi:Protein turtle [Hypsibius exemplaris]|uniref:Protein turtle n=1 Tax=Hypsibius exemplaris TaxID=2072580 RepID=A0A1W0X8F5_HYPEX|nr:Protein turtle [Hypsibius exemplaris]